MPNTFSIFTVIKPSNVMAVSVWEKIFEDILSVVRQNFGLNVRVMPEPREFPTQLEGFRLLFFIPIGDGSK